MHASFLFFLILFYPFKNFILKFYLVFVFLPNLTSRYEQHATFLFGANRVIGQLTGWACGNSAAAMSGKGCQLLVSPSAVTPSLGHMIKGHQTQTTEDSDELSSRSSMERVKQHVHQTFVGSKRQSRSHLVLPALSLRRQVLTNGKHISVESQCPVSQQHSSVSAVSAQVGHHLSETFQGKTKRNAWIISNESTLFTSRPRAQYFG